MRIGVSQCQAENCRPGRTLGIEIAFSLLLAASAWAGPAVPSLKIPILTYHRIADPDPDAYGLQLQITVPRELFRAQLHELGSDGFTPVTFAEIELALKGEKPLPPQAVVLTFDDGLDNHWDAFHDLVAAHMKGVFFVVSGMLDRPGRLTRQQVQAMVAGGMEIGSHSMSHLDLRTLKPEDREHEIAGSKRELEAVTGGPILAFAYPGGAYDNDCLPILARAGYVFARTTAPGIAAFGLSAYELDSVAIWSDTEPRKLGDKLIRLELRAGMPWKRPAAPVVQGRSRR
jgi:peptidoglycan/xylan/chitin deacetylase (PgdA/CDA1 family)